MDFWKRSVYFYWTSIVSGEWCNNSITRKRLERVGECRRINKLKRPKFHLFKEKTMLGTNLDKQMGQWAVAFDQTLYHNLLEVYLEKKKSVIFLIKNLDTNKFQEYSERKFEFPSKKLNSFKRICQVEWWRNRVYQSLKINLISLIKLEIWERSEINCFKFPKLVLTICRCLSLLSNWKEWSVINRKGKRKTIWHQWPPT